MRVIESAQNNIRLIEAIEPNRGERVKESEGEVAAKSQHQTPTLLNYTIR